MHSHIGVIEPLVKFIVLIINRSKISRGSKLQSAVQRSSSLLRIRTSNIQAIFDQIHVIDWRLGGLLWCLRHTAFTDSVFALNQCMLQDGELRGICLISESKYLLHVYGLT